jgi:hypothetical protein
MTITSIRRITPGYSISISLPAKGVFIPADVVRGRYHRKLNNKHESDERIIRWVEGLFESATGTRLFE